MVLINIFFVDCRHQTDIVATFNAIPGALCRKFQQIVCLGKQKTEWEFFTYFPLCVENFENLEWHLRNVWHLKYAWYVRNELCALYSALITHPNEFSITSNDFSFPHFRVISN